LIWNTEAICNRKAAGIFLPLFSFLTACHFLDYDT